MSKLHSSLVVTTRPCRKEFLVKHFAISFLLLLSACATTGPGAPATATEIANVALVTASAADVLAPVLLASGKISAATEAKIIADAAYVSSIANGIIAGTTCATAPGSTTVAACTLTALNAALATLAVDQAVTP